MKSNIDAIKAEMQKIKEQQEWDAAVRKVYSTKPKKYTNKMTESVKKAKHQSASRLDCFSEENSYYTQKEINRYLEGSTIYENYQATLNSDNWE